MMIMHNCDVRENRGVLNMWKNLNVPWQEAFALAWESYKKKTTPIGAVIVDENQQIIARGRNRIYDLGSSSSLSGTDMAHAEMAAMIQLKAKEHPNIRSYTLYTTMEPCPMCMGAILMMHICKLEYAAKDSFAGAIALKNKIEYTKKKTLQIGRAAKHSWVFQIVLHTAFVCQMRGKTGGRLLDSWSVDCAKEVKLGEELYAEKYFEVSAKEDVDVSVVMILYVIDLEGNM